MYKSTFLVLLAIAFRHSYTFDINLCLPYQSFNGSGFNADRSLGDGIQIILLLGDLT